MINNMEDRRRLHYLILFAIFITILSISFSYALCQENWQCFDWQKCSDNATVRDCFDISNCGTYEYMPKTVDDCQTIFPSCYDSILTNDETDIDCGGRNCMPCFEEKYCLQDSDCLTLYCFEGKCAIISVIEQPAIKILSPYYAYGLWILILISFFLVIFLIIQINHFIPYSKENEFNIDLSNYLEKKSRPENIDKEIDLELNTSKKEKEKLQKKIEKINEEKKKESAKWLEIDSIKIALPLQKEKRQKEAKPGPSELKKRQILKDIKAVYEDSYEYS